MRFIEKVLIAGSLLFKDVSASYTRKSIVQLNQKIHSHQINSSLKHVNVRGGSIRDTNEENEEERYSRQFYALGARAHSLVRTSTIIIDGPPESGLVYECVKNLALTGVGAIIFLATSDMCETTVHESNYLNSNMDDLGRIYRQGAHAECVASGMEEASGCSFDLIKEYVRRLNPSIQVQVHRREDFLSWRRGNKSANQLESVVADNGVLLSVDRPQSTQVMLNDACRATHEKKLSFVSIETAGVFGRAFCDFGNIFHVVDEDGETPKPTLLERCLIKNDNNNDSNEFIVRSVEGERHDVSKGDIIQFQWENGDERMDGILGDELIECEVTYVEGPTCIRVKFIAREEESDDIDSENIKTAIDTINSKANAFVRVKVPQKVSFLSLSQALKKQNDESEIIFAASDLDKSFDSIRRSAVMTAFAALDAFVKTKGHLPSFGSGEDDVNSFIKMAHEQVIEISMTKKKSHEGILRSFAQCANAKFTPIQAIFGALGAQEALKAASGLYNPIRQFLLYDCDEILPDSDSLKLGSKNIMSGLAYIVGTKVAKKVASKNIFVVGSGAIGCEVLKNLAALGAGTRSKGSVILTDMDTIEKSNLSRQLLFRDSDVGKFKSVAAQEAMSRLNSKMNLNVHTSKVGKDSEAKGGYFDGNFWSNKVDVVMNALDNVEARLFIDSQCVANRKGLIDAGTLGAKGNVQVVVPHQSESYGSSADPPEPAIPVCTLKNFPYEISHTIQWGRDLFDGLFSRRPSQVNEHIDALRKMESSIFSDKLIRKIGNDAALEVVDELFEDILAFDPSDVSYAEEIKEASLDWSVRLVSKMFKTSIQNLLKQHPIDSVDEDGKPFWSGTRKAPKVLEYIDAEGVTEEHRIANQYIIDFVRHCARLRIETYYSPSLLEDTDITDIVTITVEDATSALKKREQKSNRTKSNEEDSDICSHMTSKLDALSKGYGQVDDLHISEFEKDDDSNGHVAFVAAASNLRAIAYGITPVDAMETRRIAGRIIPAMITTTAFVSALSCVELIKLLQKAPVEMHRNAFINLALPFFAFTTPMPAEEWSGLHGKTYTVWDRLLIKESKRSKNNGGITLRKFMRQVVKTAFPEEDEMESVEIANISYGPYMLYANFLHEDDKSVLHKPVMELIKEAITEGDEDDEFHDERSQTSTGENEAANLLSAIENRSSIDLSVLVENTETGEEAELPTVRLEWRAEEEN
jgi:ubiquitin-activating enzyme E1